MADYALRLDHVYKKFRRGETYDSLRDLIPALTNRFFRQSELNSNDKREFWALQDVCFEAKRGESIGIIGNNGAGKSTMLKILSRIMKPTKGQMEVNGRLSALIEIGAGFHPDLTGRENIFLNGTVLGMSRKEINSKLDEIIAFSGLEEFIDTPVKRYSSGMFARLGFSVAAHVDPELLIVDEVLSVGDFAFQKQCLTKMNSIIRGGATIVFVSHNLKAVTDLCQRAVLIDKGKKVAEGTAQEVVEQYLAGALESSATREEGDASICSVRLINGKREEIRFESGERITIEIEIEANKKTGTFSLEIYLKDQNFYEIFHTSSQRLAGITFSLEQGQRISCTYEMTLNLTPGTYHIGVMLYQAVNPKVVHRVFPAKTIYVYSAIDAGGGAHLFPSFCFRQVEDTIRTSPIRNYRQLKNATH